MLNKDEMVSSSSTTFECHMPQPDTSWSRDAGAALRYACYYENNLVGHFNNSALAKVPITPIPTSSTFLAAYLVGNIAPMHPFQVQVESPTCSVFKPPLPRAFDGIALGLALVTNKDLGVSSVFSQYESISVESRDILRLPDANQIGFLKGLRESWAAPHLFYPLGRSPSTQHAR